MKKILAAIIGAGMMWGGYLLLTNFKPAMPSQEVPQTAEAPAASQNIVEYTDAGYSPKSLAIKVGETVTFKNNSSLGMWTASAKHPTHTVYPTTGGCLGSTFDACKGIQPGDSWEFKFDVAGDWKYHNHSKAIHFGEIIVEE